jgi:hypothetical protein
MPVLNPATVSRRLVAAALALGMAGAISLGTGMANGSKSPSSVDAASADTAVATLVNEPNEPNEADDAPTPVELHGRTLVVFGDSISARFNDVPGDDLQGFWSMAAHDLGVRPEVRAEGGAGYVNRGLVGCTGHTFGDQLASPGVSEMVAGAGLVVVEGGRTDTQTCRKGGGYDLVSTARLRRGVHSFLAEVQRLRGGPDACTVVVLPWGPKGPDNRDRVTRVVRNATQKYGFTFIDTLGLLTEGNTIEDRVHPDRDGNRAIADALLDQSAARACVFRSGLASLQLTQ